MHTQGIPNLGHEVISFIYTSYCSQQVTHCPPKLPWSVYGAPRFYLHRAVATFRITDCIDAPCPFCFRPHLPFFSAFVTQSSLGPSAYHLFVSIYGHLFVNITYACAYTLGIASKILYLCWHCSSFASIRLHLALRGLTTIPNTLRFTNCFETNCLFWFKQNI